MVHIHALYNVFHTQSHSILLHETVTANQLSQDCLYMTIVTLSG